jgi:hypothetical protein
MKLALIPTFHFKKVPLNLSQIYLMGNPMEDSIDDSIFEFKLEVRRQLNLIHGVSNKLVLIEEQLSENLNLIQPITK